MTIELWGTFLLTVLILNITPGPDMAYILGRTLAQGAPAGVVSAAGVCTGALVHVVIATIVFTVSVQLSSVMESVILLAGGLYLMWLGWKALREKAERLEIVAATDRKALWRIFREGVVVDVLNPKVALFFLALLPIFITDRSGHPGLWFLALGVLVVALSFLIEAVTVFGFNSARRLVLDDSSKQAVLHRIMGLVFVGLGIYALSSVDYAALI